MAVDAEVIITWWSFQPFQKEQPVGKNKIIYEILIMQILCASVTESAKQAPPKQKALVTNSC